MAETPTVASFALTLIGTPLLSQWVSAATNERHSLSTQPLLATAAQRVCMGLGNTKWTSDKLSAADKRGLKERAGSVEAFRSFWRNLPSDPAGLCSAHHGGQTPSSARWKGHAKVKGEAASVILHFIPTVLPIFVLEGKSKDTTQKDTASLLRSQVKTHQIRVKGCLEFYYWINTAAQI